MTIEEAWHWGAQQLASRLDARLLLQAATGMSHSGLLAHDDDEVSAESLSHYLATIARAAAHEPIPYILRRAPFRDMLLTVSPAVLIPRPETEELVARVLRFAAELDAPRIVDVGTGSGCIAVSLARALPRAQVVGVEVSAEALTIAKQNAAEFGAQVAFEHGSLLTPVAGQVDIIVANLPYLGSAEFDSLDENVKQEPTLALVSGTTGLELITDLLTQATTQLAPNGAIFLEIGYRQGQAVLKLANQTFPNAKIALHRDYAGNERIVSIIQTHALPQPLTINNPAHIMRAVKLLQTGKPIIFPTDTVYGVGVNPFDAAALARLYKLKGRSHDKGIPVLISDLHILEKLVVVDEVEATQKLLKHFWPGSLTVILPKRHGLPAALSPNDGVAVRMPAHSSARELIRAAGGAIATTSANISGLAAACTAPEAAQMLGSEVALILDGGRTLGGVASTIIDLRGSAPKLIRRGPISLEQVQTAQHETQSL